jgi:hypothetical protein
MPGPCIRAGTVKKVARRGGKNPSRLSPKQIRQEWKPQGYRLQVETENKLAPDVFMKNLMNNRLSFSFREECG